MQFHQKKRIFLFHEFFAWTFLNFLAHHCGFHKTEKPKSVNRSITKKGHKIRTRLCDNPKPENGGFDCNGISSDVAECQAVRECPMIHGGWSGR